MGYGRESNTERVLLSLILLAVGIPLGIGLGRNYFPTVMTETVTETVTTPTTVSVIEKQPITVTVTETRTVTITLPQTSPSYLGMNKFTVLDEVIKVKAHHFSAYSIEPFDTDVRLRIYISVIEGGPVNFFVVDEENLKLLQEGFSFMYYVKPSQKSISSIYTVEWIAPASKNLAFVIDNSDSNRDAKVLVKIVGFPLGG